MKLGLFHKQLTKLADGFILLCLLASNLGSTQIVQAAAGDTTRVSVSSSGTQGNNTSGGASISGDGRYVAFDSGATNLIFGDTNGVQDIFVHENAIETPNNSLVWNTFLGGSIEDDGKGIAVDGNSNVYITGWSKSSWGSPINSFVGGSGDAYVAKLDSSGNLIWNTFIGGSGYDLGYGIAVDGSGSVYVTGAGGGTWGTPVNSYAGGWDTFVTKLNSNGAVLWNTFLGGTNNDPGYSIAVDGNGNTYITGMSAANWGTPLDAFVGTTDIFVAKLNSSGVRVWHTFLGGNDVGGDGDVGRGIAVDGVGNVYVTGESPVSWGTPVNPHVGFRDVFVAKLNSSGTLSWNTFTGRSYGDFGQGVAIDGSSDVYVVGWSRNGSPGYSDALVARLNSSSGATVWTTYLGGGGNDNGYGIAVNNGNIYISGSSEGSWGTPVNPFAGGFNDAFVAKLNSSGALGWNTFLGGLGDDWSLGIAADGSGNLYTTGSSSSSWGIPVNEFAGIDDAFVAKIGDSIPSRLLISGNAGVAGAILSYTDESAKTAVADGNGNYSFTVPTGWSGAVTPSKAGYRFSPPNRAYTNIQTNQANQNYTALRVQLTISHVEVTQAVQDEKWPDQFPLVPLVDGKLTFVRVYLDCDSACPPGKVTGTIYGPNGESVSPHNKVSVKNVATWQSQRGDLVATLNFTLPLGWTTGTPTLRVKVEGTSVQKATRFIPARSVKIAYVPIREDGHEPNQGRINAAYSFAQKIYPTHKVDYPYVRLPTMEWSKPWVCTIKKDLFPGLYHDCIVENLKIILNNLYSNPYGDFLFGWLPEESDIAAPGIYGEADPTWGKGKGHIAFGRDHPSENAYLLAHETAHLLGRRHINKGIYQWPCNEGADADSDWPYDSPNIFPNQTVWGLDGYSLAWRLSLNNNALMNPNSTFDYMSYCSLLENGNAWTSPWTYKQILEELKIQSQSATFPSDTTEALVASEPYFIISGIVFSDDTAAFDPIWAKIPNEPVQNPPAGSTYCVEVQNVNGSLLIEHCFDLDFVNYETGEASGADGFNLKLPYSDSAVRIVLRKGSLELVSQEVSAHSPIVSVTSPNGGEAWNATNAYTIAWNASDTDGDPLTFNVYYSQDGLQWLPLGIGITDTRLTVDANELPGSSSARVRVEVSDGANTSSDESNRVFTVGSKVPQPVITSPGNNQSGVFGAPLLLSGYSYDIEDGILGDSALSWSSSIDGPLGTGASVLVSLSPGLHTITLTATDSDENSGLSEVPLTVLVCNTLAVTRTGQGSIPAASPAYSTGCPTGDYIAGESISLTAAPNSGWAISGWVGTDNDASQVSTNTVTMPTGNHTVTVNYLKPPIPGIPALLLPGNGALVNTLTALLDWKDSSPPAHDYRIQVSRNNSFTALVIDETDILTSEFTPAFNLDPGRRYFWRVKAFNGVGGASGWSGIRNFRTPLAVPMLASPFNGSSLFTDRPDFAWEDVNGATSYNIQVSKNSTFGSLLVSATVKQSDYRLINDLPQNKLLCWRVRAKASVVTGGWSGVWCFTTGNPPSVPVLLSPANNVLIRDYTPLLDWRNSTLPLPAGSTTFQCYQIQVDDNRDFSSPVIDECTTEGDIADSDFTPSSELSPNTKYYWHVRAFNHVGLEQHYSAWSAVRSFREAILPPTLLAPANGSVASSLRPTFDWTEVTGATSYTIQVSRSSTFGTLLINSTTPASTYTPTKDLPANRLIYWRVRAKGANGPSAYSEVRSLTTPVNPPHPSVVLIGAGDISSCEQDNDEATAKLLDGIEGTVFTLGDNVYPDGTRDQFANCYAPTWGRHKSRTQPVPGNHDYNTGGATGYFEYFNQIPEYYAYTLGNWRIYALNSEIGVSATSDQVTWLQNDLATNPSLCVLAYWHKPRWSSGLAHGNNSGMQTMWEILYEAGAELVVNGHEHNYERFAGMDAAGSPVSPGLREIVAGTGGQSLYQFGTIRPGSEVRHDSAYGVLKLTLNTSSYDWQFIPVAGETFTDSGSSNCH